MGTKTKKRTCAACGRDREMRFFPLHGRGRRATCADCLGKPGAARADELALVNKALTGDLDDLAGVSAQVASLARAMKDSGVAKLTVDVQAGSYEVVWMRRDTFAIRGAE